MSLHMPWNCRGTCSIWLRSETRSGHIYLIDASSAASVSPNQSLGFARSRFCRHVRLKPSCSRPYICTCRGVILKMSLFSRRVRTAFTQYEPRWYAGNRNPNPKQRRKSGLYFAIGHWLPLPCTKVVTVFTIQNGSNQHSRGTSKRLVRDPQDFYVRSGNDWDCRLLPRIVLVRSYC